MSKMSEQEFRDKIGGWELNPKSGLEIQASMIKGVWLVLDALSHPHNKKVLVKGTFDEAYEFYKNNVSPEKRLTEHANAIAKLDDINSEAFDVEQKGIGETLGLDSMSDELMSEWREIHDKWPSMNALQRYRFARESISKEKVNLWKKTYSSTA